jgi:hypothetical protein
MDETSSKKCPYCQLINPRSAARCDCGFEFSGYQVSPQEHETARVWRRKTGLRWILAGLGTLILGTVLLLGISRGLSREGISFIFYGLYGLMIGGLASIVRGIMLVLGIR